MTERERTPRVRLRDVAEAAGVNPSIASRILNDDPTLSARQQTRTRVRDAARRLGYTPNAFARGLKLQRTSTLGLVLPNVANAFNAQIVEGAERRAAHHGYVVLLGEMADFVQDGDLYRRLVLERRVDGLIISGAALDGLLGDLNRHRVPYVLVNRRSAPGASCVSADNAAGLTLAVEHLRGLGHRHVAHFAGPAGTETGADPGGEGAPAAPLGLDADLIAEAEFSEAAGFEAVDALLSTRPEVTALITSSISQGIGAVAALRRRGLAVPRDVSVVALEDAPLAAYLDPPLTTVRIPQREVAESAVDQLIKLIRSERAGDAVVPTPPELIVRDSTAAAPARA